jgi:hypothetical protein
LYLSSNLLIILGYIAAIPVLVLVALVVIPLLVGLVADNYILLFYYFIILLF